MFDDPEFLDSVNAEAPELLAASETILEFNDVFDGAEMSYDDDGVACLGIDFSVPYPGDDEPKPGESWTASVYPDEAEVWHLRDEPSGLKKILFRERMPLTEFVDLLWKLRERSKGEQA